MQFQPISYKIHYNDQSHIVLELDKFGTTKKLTKYEVHPSKYKNFKKTDYLHIPCLTNKKNKNLVLKNF